MPATPAPSPSLPLAGLRVLELGEYIAAPFATMTLADMGADVIKVERPRGDPHRHFGYGPPGSTMVFVNCNRNKRSVVLDLKTPEGCRRLRELFARSDVFCSSLRPRALEEMGLADDELARVNASAVRLYVTGYGDVGPRSGDPAYDSMLQAISGLAYVQGSGETPELLHMFMADKLTGMVAVQAILAALLERERTAKGQRLSLSILDAMAYVNFPDLFARRTEWGAAGPDLDGVTQAMRPIRTKDGWILVSPVTGAQIGRAFSVLGHPEFKDVLREYTESTALARKLVELLESATREQPTEQLLAQLKEADVPASPVLSIDEHLADPQVQANETYGLVTHPTLGDLRDVKYPVSFVPGQRTATYRPAPLLGEQTDEILAELDR